MERCKNMSTDLPPHLLELYCFKPVRKKGAQSAFEAVDEIGQVWVSSFGNVSTALALPPAQHISLHFFLVQSAEAFPWNKLGQPMLSLLEMQLGQREEEQVEISERGRWPGKSWLLANPLD